MTQTPKGSTLVFVYGTLKHGHGNHCIIEAAEHVGDAAIEGFALYDLGAFPGIVPADDGSLVHGEVYRVTPAELRRLDHLEGVDHKNPRRGLYRRKNVTTIAGEHVATYIFNDRRGELSPSRRIAAGTWDDGAPDTPRVVVTHCHTGREDTGTPLDIVARMAAEGRAAGGHELTTIRGFTAWSTRMMSAVSGGVVEVPAGDGLQALARDYLRVAASLGLVTVAEIPRERAEVRA